MCVCVCISMMVLMQVCVASTVVLKHIEVNNSVGVQEGWLAVTEE